MAGAAGTARPARAARAAPTHGSAYAALDLGTNNCRLLVAAPAERGFRVLDSYSCVSRLGEGLTLTGRLSEAAMARTLSALRVCAQKISAHPNVRLRGIATQACRVAENGRDFLARVFAETGLALEIVDPQEEARLAVVGCAALVEPNSKCALILDIGGGSTELSFVARSVGPAPPEILTWTSMNRGVVTLAEEFPEPAAGPNAAWFDAMRSAVEADLRAFDVDADIVKLLLDGRGGHLVGTSGALSSLGGVHLNLPRYARSRVDGLWMDWAEVERASARVQAMTTEERGRHPCIGVERRDLIVPGAAIVEAVRRVWPIRRVRVADRGLREGVLLDMMRTETDD